MIEILPTNWQNGQKISNYVCTPLLEQNMIATTAVKRIALFGSTGSIGKQALEVIAANPDKFSVEILTANNNADVLVQQALQYQPDIVVIGEEDKYLKVKEALAQT